MNVLTGNQHIYDWQDGDQHYYLVREPESDTYHVRTLDMETAPHAAYRRLAVLVNECYRATEWVVELKGEIEELHEAGSEQEKESTKLSEQLGDKEVELEEALD